MAVTEVPVGLPVPATISPSKVEQFTKCGLAFKYRNIDRIAEDPTVDLFRGHEVHAVLEELFADGTPDTRTVDRARAIQRRRFGLWHTDDEFGALGLGVDDMCALFESCIERIDRYFTIEDPSTVNAVGLELWVSYEAHGTTFRGVIDRLDWTPDGFEVVDYKTGKAPDPKWELGRLGGVKFYGLALEEMLGIRPVAVRLYFLADGVVLTYEPTERSSRSHGRKLEKVWEAVQRAAAGDGFGARKSRLCDWCSYGPEHQGICSAWPVNPG